MKNILQKYRPKKRPIKLKVEIKKIYESTGNAGQCWPFTNNPFIEIDPRQKPKDFLDTLIHEALHKVLPRNKKKFVTQISETGRTKIWKSEEEFVMFAANSITNMLWELGYRRKK